MGGTGIEYECRKVLPTPFASTSLKIPPDQCGCEGSEISTQPDLGAASQSFPVRLREPLSRIGSLIAPEASRQFANAIRDNGMQACLPIIGLLSSFAIRAAITRTKLSTAITGSDAAILGSEPKPLATTAASSLSVALPSGFVSVGSTSRAWPGWPPADAFEYKSLGPLATEMAARRTLVARLRSFKCLPL